MSFMKLLTTRGRPSGRPFEGLFEIGNEIFRIFDPYRVTDEALRYP